MAKGLLSKIKKSFGGGEKPAPVVASASKSKGKPKTETKADPSKVWPAKRLNVVEKVWGEGYVTPGGAEEVKKLLPLLALDSKKSVLVLGPGLGGINQTMVEETGAWVTGLERDRELAELGHKSMIRANLKRQAPVRYNDLEHIELKPKSFDAAMSFEGTLAVMDKKALFEAVVDSLRVHGELWFTDVALPDTNPPNEKVKQWMAFEPKDNVPHPWPLEAMVSMLVSLNMEVRPVQDITAEYKTWVLGGFARFLGTLSKADLIEMAQEVMTEVEYWTARISAIDSGGLKVVRYHAIKLPEKRKSVAELMG